MIGDILPIPLVRLPRILFAILVAAGLGAAVPAFADIETAGIPIPVGPSHIDARPRSFVALRDAGIVKQRYDYSCGAAAFATLLTYGLGDPIAEDEVITRVVARLDDAGNSQRLAKGLSLLDLQTLAHDMGHRAAGFRLRIDQLARLTRPAIVRIRPFGYEHFAVLRGIQDERVHLADPSLGHWRLPLWRFAEMWADDTGRGIIFVVERDDGHWLANGPLALAARDARTAPEILTARELLDVTRRFDPPRDRPLSLP